MPQPTVAHSYDRTPVIYAPGETIRLTVSAAVDDPPARVGTVTTTTVITLPDGTMSEPVVQTSQYTVDGKPGIARTDLVDSDNRRWKQASDSGSVSVWEATA